MGFQPRIEFSFVARPIAFGCGIFRFHVNHWSSHPQW